MNQDMKIHWEVHQRVTVKLQSQEKIAPYSYEPSSSIQAVILQYMKQKIPAVNLIDSQIHHGKQDKSS